MLGLQAHQATTLLTRSFMHVLASHPSFKLLTHHHYHTHAHQHSNMESVKAAATFATSNLIRPVRLLGGAEAEEIREDRGGRREEGRKGKGVVLLVRQRGLLEREWNSSCVLCLPWLGALI